MPLEQKDFDAIENYLKSSLPRLLAEQSLGRPPVVYEIELRERMVRVEEELKNQRELMNRGFDFMEKRFEQVEKRFEQVEKRFEQVDKRFEQVDKRFEQMDKRFDELSNRLLQFMIWSFGLAISATGVIIAVMKLS